MRMRWTLLGLVLAAVLVISAAAAAVPVTAQGAKKIIKISMVSYKFIPDTMTASVGDVAIITVNRGDTVIFQFSNDDPARRSHSFAARWLVNMEVQGRGDRKSVV